MESMECVKNLFSLKSNNLLLGEACAVAIYKLRGKTRSFIQKVTEEEVCSVREAVCFQCQHRSRESVLSVKCVRQFE
jgi:hypothetical protein